MQIARKFPHCQLDKPILSEPLIPQRSYVKPAEPMTYLHASEVRRIDLEFCLNVNLLIVVVAVMILLLFNTPVFQHIEDNF